MVLAALGEDRPASRWAKFLDSYDFGTPASNVKNLQKIGYQVRYGTFSLDKLQSYMREGAYPIVFVRAGELPWSDFDSSHALVLTQIDPTKVKLHDPALPDGPTYLSKEEFLLAWSEFDYLAAIISH
jgi:ABC-type bacteriocin/lantibiotic exporter with double-glycine peptidase domain